MSFSAPQVVESRIQFSPVPQDDNQIHVNNRHIVVEPCEEPFDWDYSLVIILRLALIVTFLVGLALRQGPFDKLTSNNPIPPNFYLDALHIPNLKISNGELSSTWEMTLTISNAMNASNINILRLDAAMCYKENDTLAMNTPIMQQYAFQSQVFPLEAEETKKVHLNLSTTGWENEQPVVDDAVAVIQAMVKDMVRGGGGGVMRFSLHLRVVGEVENQDGSVAPFTLYPKCNGLRVKLVGTKEKSYVATLIDPKLPQECVGLVQWGQDQSETHGRN